MAVNEELRNRLPKECVVFDAEAYDNSIVGISISGEVIYSYKLMIQEYMKDHECTDIEAIEWIEYNTIRALPYFPDNRPIIMYDLEDCFE